MGLAHHFTFTFAVGQFVDVWRMCNTAIAANACGAVDVIIANRTNAVKKSVGIKHDASVPMVIAKKLGIVLEKTFNYAKWTLANGK